MFLSISLCAHSFSTFFTDPINDSEINPPKAATGSVTYCAPSPQGDQSRYLRIPCVRDFRRIALPSHPPARWFAQGARFDPSCSRSAKSKVCSLSKREYFRSPVPFQTAHTSRKRYSRSKPRKRIIAGCLDRLSQVDLPSWRRLPRSP